MNKLKKTEHAVTCPVSNRRFPQRELAKRRNNPPELKGGLFF